MTNSSNAPDDTELFAPVSREATLANRVTKEIGKLIIDGRIEMGQRLPSERDLADQFGVSRTVVREAVRGLVAKGWLEVRPGSGTIVRSPTAGALTQSLTLLLRGGLSDVDYTKVHEIRRLLEIEIAGLAAERTSNDDLAKLAATLDEMEANRADRDLYAKSDVAFHAALAAATHNELFPLLLDSIVDIMVEVRQLGFDVPGSSEHALSQHRAILEQVRSGNAKGARQAMRKHLDYSEDVMRRALELQARASYEEEHH
jgi:GntR family transcriptional regulator, transcriptional repressor for pyruvate dehydrogenase complex